MSSEDVFRVRVWHSWYDDYPEEPDETVRVRADEPVLWQDDPYYHESLAFDIHPDDAPATLYIRTNDSVRNPPLSDASEWSRAVERGLPFDPMTYDKYPPFGTEIWGRIRLTVEEGLTR
jgi:hypothetical protein